MTDDDTLRPYEDEVWRVAILLDVRAKGEKDAFRKINRIMQTLGDRRPLDLSQVGFQTQEAREPIAGCVVFLDQLRRVVAPAPPQPLPSIGELLDSAMRPEYRPGQMTFDDPARDRETR